jgi:hypothetical protein
MAKEINMNFEVLAPGPIDTRMQVATQASLAGIPVKFDQMVTRVLDEEKDYVYKLSNDTWAVKTSDAASISWGSIIGTLTSQTDLVNEFAKYALTTHTHPAGSIPAHEHAPADITDVDNQVAWARELVAPNVILEGSSSSGSFSDVVTTKGDLYTFSTVKDRLPVGADGQVLSVDPTEPTGLKWVEAGGVDLSGLVPYTGATTNVDLGNKDLTTTGVIAGSNLSGSNTGDNAVNSLYSGLVSNVSTQLSLGTISSTQVSITSDGAVNDVTLPEATGSDAGLLSSGKYTEIGSNTSAKHTHSNAAALDLVSGTNTGDQTSIVGLTGTKSQFDTAVTDGDFLYVGDVSSNVPTNLSYTGSATQGVVVSSDGTDATLPAANGTNAGLLLPGDFTRLANTSGTNTGDQDLPQSGVDFDPVGTDNSDNNAANTLYANDYRAANFISGTDYEPAKGADDNFVTDAEKVVIGNTSGANTGDQVIPVSGVDFDPVGTDNSDNNAANSTYANDYRAANFVAGTNYQVPLVADTDYLTPGTAATTYAPVLGANDNYVTDAEKTVIGNTSGTNSGDNAVNSNYSGLVTNATHTGEVTGSGALTLANTAISNKTLVTAVGADHVMIIDATDGNLKKALISDFSSAGGDMAASTYDPNTVSGDVFDMDNMVEGTTTKILTAAERTILGNTSGTNTGDQSLANYVTLDGTQTITGFKSLDGDVNIGDGTNELHFRGRKISAYIGGTLGNLDFEAVQTYFNSDFLIGDGKWISTKNGSTLDLELGTSDASKGVYTSRYIHADGEITGSNLSGTNTGDQDISGKVNTPTESTGVALVLSDQIGRPYNMGAANGGTTYTTSGLTPMGWAVCRINTTSEPTVTGATKISGADWVTGTDMHMIVQTLDGTNVQYFFIAL